MLVEVKCAHNLDWSRQDHRLTWEVAGSIHLQSNEPLFQQYVSMSGTCFLRPRSAAAVQTAYDTLVRDLGFADFNPQEQMDRILEDNEQGKLRGLSRKYNLGPTVDGKIVPEALDFRSLVEPAQALHSLPGLRYCRMLLIGDSGFDVSLKAFAFRYWTVP